MTDLSFRRFIDIRSAVGGAAAVASRALIARILTDNPLTPADNGLEFANAAAVANYYGGASQEAALAGIYFGYVSTAFSSPKLISFGRYSPAGGPARLIGGSGVKSLVQFQAVTAGALNLVADGVAVPLTAIDLSAASSLTAVATALQTLIAATPALTGTTVAYDAISRRFTLQASNGGAIKVELGASTPLSGLLQWGIADGAIVSPAVDPQTASDAYRATVEQSDNFGALLFYPALSLTDTVTVAQLVAAENVRFQYHVPLRDAADAQTWAAALQGYAGVGLTYSPLLTEYPELFPAMQMAATDYNARNGVVNYMFKSGPFTPSVTTDALADIFDPLRINYYGRTKTAGQGLAFYMRGYLQGDATAPLDMNVYANEQWLKDDAGANLMTLLLSASRVPANETGVALVLNALQDTIQLGLFNGSISIGKELSTAQKAAVTQVTGDPLAWHQVQQQGFWVTAQIEQFTNTAGVIEYRAVYVLVYSKDDAIRSVNGTHVLI